MVRFGTQGPGVALQMPNWDAEYKRATPFKQAIGLYNMWQSLSPDTRNAIAKLFGGGEDEILDAPAEMGRDEVLDEITNPNTGYLQVMPDGSFSQLGELDYSEPEGPNKWQPENPLDAARWTDTDPWGIGNIDTDPFGNKERTYKQAVKKQAVHDKNRPAILDTWEIPDTNTVQQPKPSTLSERQTLKSLAGGNQNVDVGFAIPQNNLRDELFGTLWRDLL